VTDRQVGKALKLSDVVCLMLGVLRLTASQLGLSNSRTTAEKPWILLSATRPLG
jgi:hypothetical protein